MSNKPTQETTNSIKPITSTKIKAIQLIIVLVLLITSFYAGKISMSEQIYTLFDRIDQLESQMNEMQQ